MKTYIKPVISVDSGLAEGVYAASGAASVTFAKLSKESDWGNDNGQLKSTISFSDTVNLSQLTLKITFNQTISSAWADGASASISGSEVSFTWYSAPESAEFYIQVNEGLSTLSITGYSCTNA